MTEKPDYMQMAREMLGPNESGFMPSSPLTLARTLEALDTERTAHEATKRGCEAYKISATHWCQMHDEQKARADKAEAELQALHERAEKVLQLAQASDIEKAETDCRAFLRSLLPQPAADPLVEAIKDCGYATLDCIEPEFAAALREALARHGLTITEKQG